ncbi:MAG TPA: serine/threonine protein kinase [Polyangiaceae bacterium]|nr:serine/threonine protein kinase [Polyangiaceae bacterium]
MTQPTDDPRVQQILENCYSAIYAGQEPDVAALCGDNPELQPHIERMLQREQALLSACAESASDSAVEFVPADGSTNGAPRVPPMPERIGAFTILEPIGVGGMSRVYRAREEPLGREVALKVLRTDLVASTTGRLRFTREASITASLEHPHIVPVFAAGEADGFVFLAMKLLRGRSLDRLATPLSRTEIARIGRDAARALQAAHDIGVVHRDVKPANIVVQSGHAFVVDFGLAAFADRASLLTQPNATPGTLIYLPPEVARRQASGLDPRADVYGLGATLYELLAGRPPFHSDHPVRTLNQILHHDPQPLGLRGRDRDLETIVLRAMEKSPQRRFQSANALADELQRYLDGEPITTRAPNRLTRTLRWMRRRPVITALAAATTILAAALVLQTAARWRSDRLSLQRGITAVRAAVAAGHLDRAQDRLRELGLHPLADSVPASLATAVRREHDLQLLTAALQNPLARRNRAFTRRIVQRLSSETDDRAGSARQLALQAIASPDDHRGAATSIRSRLPRTAALLAARDAGKPLAGVLAHILQPSDPLDHLFAAIVLRGDGQPESDIENELRAVPAHANGALWRDSLCISLEAQGRLRAAYDLAQQLLDDPICGQTARWTAARLAASIGATDAAREHLRTALATERRDELVDHLATPSELQVLAELAGGEVFWQRWRSAAPNWNHLPQYWRVAGYVAAEEARLPEELVRARSLFEEGLACADTPATRTGLEVCLLQLRWRSLAMQLQMGLPDANVWDGLQQLAHAGEQLAHRIEANRYPKEQLADALVTAARAYLVLGQEDAIHLARARSLLDQAATLEDPAALVAFASHVAGLAAEALLGPGGASEPEDSGFGTLAATVPLAADRARRVLAQASTGNNVDAELIDRAKVALLFLAAHDGDARTALEMARACRELPEATRATSTLAGEVERWGGLLLDRLDRSNARLPARLDQATAAVELAWRRGDTSSRSVIQTIARWRGQLPDAAASEGPDPWRQARRQLDDLEAMVQRPRKPD